MGVYDDDIATAKELIAESGETSVIKRLTPGVVDVNKPWLPVDAVPTEHNVSAVWLNYKSAMSGQMQDGSLVKIGDKKVLVAAIDLADISTSDQIERADGTLYKIENAKLLDPNGQKILYELQVRQ